MTNGKHKPIVDILFSKDDTPVHVWEKVNPDNAASAALLDYQEKTGEPTLMIQGVHCFNGTLEDDPGQYISSSTNCVVNNNQSTAKVVLDLDTVEEMGMAMLEWAMRKREEIANSQPGVANG
jgi:hypothetical protein